MTKKSIFRDHFSWKVRTFHASFQKDTTYYCSISQPHPYNIIMWEPLWLPHYYNYITRGNNK